MEGASLIISCKILENSDLTCRLIFLLGSLWFSPSLTFAILNKCMFCVTCIRIFKPPTRWRDQNSLKLVSNIIVRSSSLILHMFYRSVPSIHPWPQTSPIFTQQYVEQEVRVIFGFYLRSSPHVDSRWRSIVEDRTDQRSKRDLF